MRSRKAGAAGNLGLRTSGRNGYLYVPASTSVSLHRRSKNETPEQNNCKTREPSRIKSSGDQCDSGRDSGGIEQAHQRSRDSVVVSIALGNLRGRTSTDGRPGCWCEKGPATPSDGARGFDSLSLQSGFCKLFSCLGPWPSWGPRQGAGIRTVCALRFSHINVR